MKITVMLSDEHVTLAAAEAQYPGCHGPLTPVRENPCCRFLRSREGALYAWYGESRLSGEYAFGDIIAWNGEDWVVPEIAGDARLISGREDGAS